jgi:hypothetical protein
MPEESPIDSACAVCERRLLPGERAIQFVTGDGTEVDVCELCKPRAEAAGWLRPEEAAMAMGSMTGRERRRPRGSQAFGGLLSRRQVPTGEPEVRPHSTSMGEEQAETPVARPSIAGPGTTFADALYAFNHSDHRRTVAGLTRTLGDPRASALAIKTRDGSPGVRLTIAWELTWYQWEVAPGDRGHDVRESGKGETIAQLGSADRTWNLMVDSDGTLEQKSSSSSSSSSSEPVAGE